MCDRQRVRLSCRVHISKTFLTQVLIFLFRPYLKKRGIKLDPQIKSYHQLKLQQIYTVRTAQFDTILNEPSVIIIQMRINTCLPESVPRVIPHLETRITDTSFIQNNIKSGSPGMCSNIRPGSAYAHTIYNRI